LIVELGASVFSERIAHELEKRGVKVKLTTTKLRDFRFKEKIKDYPVVHFTGSPTVTFTGLLALIRFRWWHKKIVVSWVGFDIRRIKNNFFWRFCTKIFLNYIDVNITDDKYVANELKQFEIPARVQPLPVYLLYQLYELPKIKKIAVYLPDYTQQDFKFYQGDLIKKLVDNFSEVEFVITGNSGRHFENNKNVTSIEWCNDMEALYKDVIAVIRLPRHDATGATIIETLSMGRTMIASATNFPYCKKVYTFQDAKNHLKEIIQKPILNIEASKFVHKNYNNAKLADDLIKICKSLL